MWMRLKSAAGTGYYYTIRRPKSKMGLDKMTLRKYDPVGKLYLTTGGGGGGGDGNHIAKIMSTSLLMFILQFKQL